MRERLAITSLGGVPISAIVSLVRRCGPEVRPRCAADYWLPMRLFPDYCCGLLVDTTLAGIVIALPHRAADGADELYVQDVATDPRHRGRGVATHLLLRIARVAQERSMSRIWLTSRSANAPAIATWSALGFANVPGDYCEHGVWVLADLKGPGCDRAVFETTPEQLCAAASARLEPVMLQASSA